MKELTRTIRIDNERQKYTDFTEQPVDVIEEEGTILVSPMMFKGMLKHKGRSLSLDDTDYSFTYKGVKQDGCRLWVRVFSGRVEDLFELIDMYEFDKVEISWINVFETK